MEEITAPCLTQSALVEVFEDEYVIHLPEKATTYLIDPLLALILSHCDGHHSVHEITDKIIGHYPEKSRDIKKDVPDLIAEMLEVGVLQEQGIQGSSS